MAATHPQQNDFNNWPEVKRAFTFNDEESHILAGWTDDKVEIWVKFVVEGDSMEAKWQEEDLLGDQWYTAGYGAIETFVEPFDGPMVESSRSAKFRRVWALAAEHLKGVPKEERPAQAMIERALRDQQSGSIQAEYDRFLARWYDPTQSLTKEELDQIPSMYRKKGAGAGIIDGLTPETVQDIYDQSRGLGLRPEDTGVWLSLGLILYQGRAPARLD